MLHSPQLEVWLELLSLPHDNESLQFSGVGMRAPYKRLSFNHFLHSLTEPQRPGRHGRSVPHAHAAPQY